MRGVLWLMLGTSGVIALVSIRSSLRGDPVLRVLMLASIVVLLVGLSFPMQYRIKSTHFSIRGQATGTTWAVFLAEELFHATDIVDAVETFGVSIGRIEANSVWSRSALVGLHTYWGYLFLSAFVTLVARFSKKPSIFTEDFFLEILPKRTQRLFEVLTVLSGLSLLASTIWLDSLYGILALGCIFLFCLLVFFYDYGNICDPHRSLFGFFSIRLQGLAEDAHDSTFWRTILSALSLVLFGTSIWLGNRALGGTLLGEPDNSAPSCLLFSFENLIRVVDFGDIMRVFKLKMHSLQPAGFWGALAVALFRLSITYLLARNLRYVLNITGFIRFAPFSTLVESLSSLDLEEGENALQELVRRKSSAALIKMVDSGIIDHELAIEGAIVAIRKVEGAKAAPFLRRALFDRTGGTRGTLAAAQSLMEIKDTAVVPLLKEKIRSGDCDHVHCDILAETLVAIDYTEYTVAFLLEMASSPDRSLRFASATQLAKLEQDSKDVVEVLLRLTGDEEDLTRAAAISGLSKFKCRDFAPQARKLLEHPPGDANRTTLELLEYVLAIQDKEALPILRRICLGQIPGHPDIWYQYALTVADKLGADDVKTLAKSILHIPSHTWNMAKGEVIDLIVGKRWADFVPLLEELASDMDTSELDQALFVEDLRNALRKLKEQVGGDGETDEDK